MPAGREALIARVRAAAAGEGGLGGAALAALLPAFGEALADAVLPAAAAGGRAELERALAPLLVLAAHADPACRAAAVEARGKLLDRLMELSRSELLLRVLDALVAAGWDRREADLRLAWLALTRGADPAEALPPARRLATSPGQPAEAEVRLWRLYGSMLEAAALLADRRPAEAHGALDRAGRVAAGLVAERLDLRPSPSDPSSRFGDLAVERAHLAGVVELLRAACLLEEGRAWADLSVLEAARRAHVRSLEAQLLARRADAQVSASTLDALLDRELAPRRLVLANGRNARWTRSEQLDLDHRLLEALASVAPGEMPGVAAAEDLPAHLADPLADPERRQLLESIHLAEAFVFDRRELELRERLEELRRAGVAQDDPAWRRLARELQRLYELRARHQDDVDRWRDPPEGTPPDLEQLLSARGPSAAPLTLALDLRAEGRPREAIEIAEGMLAALDDPRYAALEWMRAFTGARLLLCIGGGYTDDDLPQQAEEKLLAAVDRLVELESGIRDVLDGLSPDEDPSVRAGYQANLAATERLRGQVLVSLAVNANVKMGDVERALEYFERAYELDQSDFMKVLRGCYRARVGRAEEARKGLLEVQVAPELYYNMACTWALLGEDELALDFLTRELAENHPTPGSHARQRDWAASDPDLESLRGDPRFRRLVDTPLGEDR
jgi:tetratricopeptide (TPR) repeat protein